MAVESARSRQRAFWQAACRALPDLPTDAAYQVWHFGDSVELARELADLVLHGAKRATAGLLWDAENDPDMMPVVGGYSLVTDYAGAPLLIIQTTKVTILGRAPSPEMPVILERFALIYPTAAWR